MSFDSKGPLFPYRVPKDNRYGWMAHVLRVHFVGPERVRGTLGEKKAEWAGEIRYAKSRDDIKELLAGTGPAAEVTGTWLTSFDDESWPGGAEDLHFEKAPVQEPFVTVQQISHELFVPLDFLFCLVFVLGIGVRKHRQNRVKSS